MSDQERWTVGRLLQWTTDYLKKNSSPSPRLDAEVLLATARGCQRIQLYTAFEDEPAEPVRTTFRELVKRRAAGEPVAYLVGHREFYSLSFEVSPAVLIPRPETEFVVIGVLDVLKQSAIANRVLDIVDVGTGSGAIAISVAKHAENARITAIEISCAALAIARANANRHAVADRIEFVESDLFARLPADRQFDIIASNPPYVADGELALMAKETRDHEPRQALIAGPSGTEIIERLIVESRTRLRTGGWLFLEISPMIEIAVRALFAADALFTDVSTIKDLAGLARVIKARSSVG